MASIGDLLVTIRASSDAYSADLKAIQRENSALVSSMKPFTKTLGDIGGFATKAGAALTAGLTLPLAAIGGLSLKAASDFQSSFAGVRKTVEATEPEFAKLAQGFRDMSREIPVSVNQLNKVGEAAGQLGIKKEDILGFTRVMADLGVTTNLTADQAATSIAQIQNIFGAAGKDVDRFGATLVALGNAGASTEKDIVEMSARIAGAGHQVGLTQGEVLAFASSLASVGINAEAGGSALSRIFLKMNDAVKGGGSALEDFARVSGVTAAEFKKSFETDAAGATAEFVAGLGRIKEANGNVGATVEGLVGKNIILKDTLARLSGAGDLLNGNLALQAKAWQENKALVDEAKKRYETFESQLQVFKNQLNDVAITIGMALLPMFKRLLESAKPAIDMIADLANKFAELPTWVQGTSIAILGAAAAMGPLLIAVGQTALGLKGLIPELISVGGYLGKTGLGQAALGAVTSLTGAGGLGGALTAVVGLLTGPVGLTIAAGAAVVGLGYFIAENESTRAAAISAWESIKDLTSGVIDLLKNMATAPVHAFSEALRALGVDAGSTSELLAGVKAFFTGKLAADIQLIADGLSTAASSVKVFSSYLAALRDPAATIMKQLHRDIVDVAIDTDVWFADLIPGTLSSARNMNELRAEIVKAADAQKGAAVVAREAKVLTEDQQKALDKFRESVDKVKASMTDAVPREWLQALRELEASGKLNSVMLDSLAGDIDKYKSSVDPLLVSLRAQIAVEKELKSAMELRVGVQQTLAAKHDDIADKQLLMNLRYRDAIPIMDALTRADAEWQLSINKSVTAMSAIPLQVDANVVALTELKDSMDKLGLKPPLVRIGPTPEETRAQSQNLKDAVDDVRKSAGAIFDAMFLKGEGVFSSLQNALKGGALSLGRSIFEDITAQLLGPIKQAFDNFFKGLLEGSGFTSFLNGIGKKIGGALSGGSGGVGGGVGGDGAVSKIAKYVPLIGGAIAGVVEIGKALVGRGRETADEFIEAFQNPFDQAIINLHDAFYDAARTGKLSIEEAAEARFQVEKLWDAFKAKTAEFANEGGNQAKVVAQAFARVSEVWGTDLSRIIGGFDSVQQALYDQEQAQISQQNSLNNASEAARKAALDVEGAGRQVDFLAEAAKKANKPFTDLAAAIDKLVGSASTGWKGELTGPGTQPKVVETLSSKVNAAFYTPFVAAVDALNDSFHNAAATGLLTVTEAQATRDQLSKLMYEWSLQANTFGMTGAAEGTAIAQLFSKVEAEFGNDLGLVFSGLDSIINILRELEAGRGVPQYAHGTDYVPHTGLAMVHRGERITPAGENGGGNVMNVYVQIENNFDNDRTFERLASKLVDVINRNVKYGGGWSLAASELRR